jgi:hypothetical protein
MLSAARAGLRKRTSRVALKRSAVRLLGNSGSAKSIKVLKGYASDKDKVLSGAVSEAIEKIKKREQK